MFAYSAIANLPQNLQVKALQMHKNSLRTAPVSAIPPTNSTQTLAKNLSGILFDTSTGAPLKWSVLAWKLRQQEILRGKSSGTEVSHSKSFRNVMLTQQRILNSYSEKPDCKTPTTDRTA
jgi:hypothetical protein